jgi:hypothetical protein
MHFLCQKYNSGRGGVIAAQLYLADYPVTPFRISCFRLSEKNESGRFDERLIR